MIRLIIFLLTVTIVAVASCLLVFYVFLRPEMPVTHQQQSFIERLDLDDALRVKISTIDKSYEVKREESIVRFRAAIVHLSELLSSVDSYNEEVTQAIDAVHVVHGNFHSQSWIDNKGEARFILERELILTPRLGIFGETEYDTREKWSYQAGMSYALTQYISTTALWDSKYGVGAGLSIRF